MNPLRVAWVTHTLGSGGIGPVCRYAAEAGSRHGGWHATVVSVHEEAKAWTDAESGVRYVSLGMAPQAPQEFLHWLASNPQDVLFTNDVSTIEACFPYFPPEMAHVIQIHDSAPRHRRVAIQNQRWVDGIVTVGDYFRQLIASELNVAGFQGILATLHNGASFPPAPTRSRTSGPLRLLFMGRLDPLVKGTYDLVPILRFLARAEVDFSLQVVGGYDEGLKHRFRRAGLAEVVRWEGCVPHNECYGFPERNDIFLLPSRHEPFGMVTIEAMGMGCVPIAYDIPSGSREIIENGKNGFLLPLGDFKAWAEEIARLEKDRDRLCLMAQSAIQRARTRFSVEALATRLVRVVALLRQNAKSYRPIRLRGAPAAQGRIAHQTAYHGLSPRVRAWIRQSVAPHPRLSSWLIRNWL